MNGYRWLRQVLWTILLVGAAWAPAHGQAYCYVRELTSSTLSNGVQITIKADGILTWFWQKGRPGQDLTEVQVQFPSARLGADKTLYDIDQEPVSSATLMVPQDAKDGRGVVLTVTMAQPAQVEATLSEDRQAFLLTVYGKRTVERTPTGSTVAALTEGTSAVSIKDGLISVRAVKANIHEVVSEVARLSDISVALDDAVRRNVTLNVQDRKPVDLLRSLAAGYGLAFSTMGDLYTLSEGVPTDISTYRHSDTASFPMTYLKASDAKSLLPTFLFKYVHDNPEQNAVVVTAPGQMLDKIGRDLKAIDVPPPMLMIECAVIELTDDNDLDAEFRWQYSSPEHSASTNNGTGDIDYHQVDTTDGLVTALADTVKLQTWLQALKTKGHAEVKAHPSMAAVNGKFAEIFIGSQRFIKMQYSKNGVMQDKLETVPVGVRLQIRPWTGGNDEITSWINVEVSNIVQIDPQSGIPRLGTRVASTTMRTKDGDTIVIGGLSQRQDEVTNRRVPILGDLPLVGNLFRSKETRKSNAELVILIRPRLLDATGRLPADEDAALRERFLAPDKAPAKK